MRAVPSERFCGRTRKYLTLSTLQQNAALLIPGRVPGGFCQPQAFLQNTAEDIALKSMQAASRARSQSEVLLPARFK
jgi:hypothetical protein